MELVQALTESDRVRSILRSGLAQHVKLVFVDNPSELQQAVSSRPPAIVLLSLSDQGRQSTVPLVRRLSRHRSSQTCLIGLCDIRTSERVEVVAAAKAGLADVLFTGFDEPWAVVRRVLLARAASAGTASVLRILAPVVSADGWEIVVASVEHAREGLDAPSLGARLGISVRSLSRRCLAAGLPSPKRVIAWARLFLAASLLRRPERHVKDVARELGFASTRALQELSTQFAGVRPTALRDEQAMAKLLSAFLRDSGDRRGMRSESTPTD